MPGVIKRVACDALVEYLLNEVPDLDGVVHVAPAPPNEPIGDRCLVLIPRKFRFTPFQEDVRHEPAGLGGTQVSSVGEVTGTIEMQLLATTDDERDDLEDAINHAFYRREGSPGVVVVGLQGVRIGGGYVLGYTPSCAYTHEGEEWVDEFAFSNRKWRWMDVGVTFPALVARQVSVIDKLYLAITNDLAGNVAQESIQVLEDGSIVKE